jgi:hypothetical protein
MKKVGKMPARWVIDVLDGLRTIRARRAPAEGLAPESCLEEVP